MSEGPHWPEPMPVVEVAWTDAHSAGGWDSVREHRENAAGPHLCRSVGYLLEDVPERVSIVQSRSSVGSVAEILTVPRGMVAGVTVLREPIKEG